MNHDIGLTAAKITFKVKYMPSERLTVVGELVMALVLIGRQCGY